MAQAENKAIRMKTFMISWSVWDSQHIPMNRLAEFSQKAKTWAEEIHSI